MEAAADPAQHARLTGTAPAGRVLRLHKDVITDTRIAGLTFPDVLDSTMVVPAGGSFTWDIDPSTRPAASTTEAWRLTCETADGTVLQSQDVVVARGQQLGVTPCPAEAPATSAASTGAAGSGGGAPGGAPVTGPSSPPGGDGVARSPAPVALSLRISPTSLRTARGRGVAVRADCPKRCTLTLSLRAGTRTVGRVVVKRLVGRRTVRVRLRSHNRALTLVASATGGVRQTVRRAIRLA
jgi:hypothetical protein